MLKSEKHSYIIIYLLFIPILLMQMTSANADNSNLNSPALIQKESKEKTGGFDIENFAIEKIINHEEKSSDTPRNSVEISKAELESPVDVKPDDPPTEKSIEIDLTPFTILNELHRTIYSGKYTEAEAKKIFFENINAAAEIYRFKDGGNYKKENWVFPVAGYDHKTTLLERYGYRYRRKYNYFSSTYSTDHAAYDLFIKDENSDLLDDTTKMPVNILSVTGGVVIACVNNWDEKLNSAGGNNILIYDPYYHAIYYYAHNNKVFVKAGDIVKPGDVIATMGRTGRNAIMKRSPTHLHIAYLKIKNNNLIPVNIYRDLKKMKIKKIEIIK